MDTFQKLKENCVGTFDNFLKPGIFGIQYPGSKKKCLNTDLILRSLIEGPFWNFHYLNEPIS